MCTCRFIVYIFMWYYYSGLVLLQLMLFIAAGRLQLLCLSVHFTALTAAARVCVFVFITMWGRPLTHMLWGPKYNVGTKGPHKAECYKLRSRLLVFVNPYSNIYHTMFLNCFTTCWPTNNNIYNTSSSWQLTKECSLFTRVQESIITFTFITHQQQFGVQYLAQGHSNVQTRGTEPTTFQ